MKTPSERLKIETTHWSGEHFGLNSARVWLDFQLGIWLMKHGGVGKEEA